MEEEPPTKRRRTSPRLSSGASSPPRPSLPPSRNVRPSFASPTRSSMLRSHPEILERRSSSPAKTNPSRRSQPVTAGASQPNPSTASHVSTLQVTQENPPEIPASEVQRETGGEEVQGGEDQEVAEPQAEVGTSRPPPDAATASRGAMSQQPIRSPLRPTPRPLPQREPGEEDALSRLFSSRPRHFSNLGVAAPSQPEPELPPSSPDNVASTPPRGIHSSPSRWKGKRKKAFKSSPLKPRPERPARRGPPFTRTVGLDLSTSEERGVPAFDANHAKIKERDALQKELSDLAKDLEIVRKENERIRLMHSSGRTLEATDETAVRRVVRRYLLPKDKENADMNQAQILVKAALDPMGFMLLGRPPKKVSAVHDFDPADIRSHHPVPMTAEEELPYLQLFSPFRATSKVSCLPAADGATESRQHHAISLRSADNHGLFAARIEMVVDATNLTVSELSVPALEPSARPEMQAFLDKVCGGDCNRSMQRNVGVASWAMAEWYRVALRRACFWLQLEHNVNSKGGIPQMARRIREKRAKRTRAHRHSEEDSAEAVPETPGLDKFARKDILRVLGKRSYELSIPPVAEDDDVTVLLNWEIRFDWTGEAESVMGVTMDLPSKWRTADSRGSLGKLSVLFQHMVERQRNPADAVDTVIALLVGET